MLSKVKENKENIFLEKQSLTTLNNFIKNNKANFMIVGFFLLLAYGLKVFNILISHDTEALMSISDSLYQSWISMGRFGLVALKYLLGTSWFNPYVASFMLPVCLFIASIIWMYLFAYLNNTVNQKKMTRWIFPVVFFTAPIMAEQSGFLLQAYEIAFSIALVGIAIFSLYYGILNYQKRYYVLSSLLIVLFFSIYQALVVLFVAGTIAGFILLYDGISKNEEVNSIYYWKIILKIIVTFIISTVIYYIINKTILQLLSINTTSYITDQVLWMSAGIVETIKSILLHIKDVLLGKRIFYSKLLLPLILMLIIYTVYRLKNREKNYYIYVLSVIAILVSPFLMTIILGQCLAVRTEITIPFVLGFLCFYLANLVDVNFNKALKYLVVLLMFCVGMHQGQQSSRIYYTEYVKYQEDIMLATKISNRIEELNFGETPEEPVVFVGYRNANRNNSSYSVADQELIGKSYFEVSFSTQHGTFVIENYLRTLGIVYNGPTEEQVEIANAEAQNMPAWPDVNSVKEYDGIIIVKLS